MAFKNKTLSDLGIRSLESIESQMLDLLTTPDIPAKDVSAALVTFKLSRTAAHTMLVSASASNPGYEVRDFPRDLINLLARVDRLFEIAGPFAATAE